MKFDIYHPAFGELNTLRKPNSFEYERITTIEADSLDEVFTKSQNDFNEDYALLDVRSTSIGDIVEDIDDERYYIIEPNGFTEVNCMWVNFVNWKKKFQL